MKELGMALRIVRDAVAQLLRMKSQLLQHIRRFLLSV